MRAERAAPSPWLAQTVPEPLVMVVDGMMTTVRPAVLPSIVQLSVPGGKILWTRYVPPGTELPAFAPYVARAEAYEADILPPALQIYREIGERRQERVQKSGLTLAGIALWTTSAALYVTNANVAAEYDSPETLPARLPALQRTVNLTATGSSLFFIAGSGFILTSLLR